MTNAPFPVFLFSDTFSWNQYPLTMTTVLGIAFSIHENGCAKASDKTVSIVDTHSNNDSLTGCGLGEVIMI